MNLATYFYVYGVDRKTFASDIPVHPNTITNWLKLHSFPRDHHIERVDKLTNGKVKRKDWEFYWEAKKRHG